MCGILWYDLRAGGAGGEAPPGPAEEGDAELLAALGGDGALALEAARAAHRGFMRLRHRGPDHTGFAVAGGAHFLGAHRLAITGLGPAGDQPLSLGGATMVCNGQIYNYTDIAWALSGAGEGELPPLRSDLARALRTDVSEAPLRTDVDAVLRGCVALGSPPYPDIDGLARALDGDFAFAVVSGGGTVYLARDPVGVRPLFYGTDAAGAPVCAASEVKAIRDLPGVQECRVFPPGHVWDSESGRIRSYTDLYDEAGPDAPEAQLSFDEAAAELRRLLTAAVEKRLECSDRPVALLCSGGIDSSVILSLAHGLIGADRIHVFSMQYDCPRCPRSDDAFYAGLLAAQFGVRHTAVHFSWADVEACVETVARQLESYDPNTLRAAVPMYLLAERIRETTDYKVLLSGEGADELLMGYNTFLGAPDARAANAESVRLVRNIHMFDALRADRCFNAHGLELRVPFLDPAVARAVLRFDGAHKMIAGDRIEKALLRHAFSDCPRLRAARVLDRGKERFSDGCGSAYVPDLLNHWAPGATFETKQARERAVYREWFDRDYPGLGHLIVKRENPSWCAAPQAAESLVGM